MSYSQTCNLLTHYHYVKDKRVLSIRPISNPNPGEMTNDNGISNKRATMDLFPVKGQTNVEDSNSNGFRGHTINLFPQSSGFTSSSFTHPTLMADSSGSKRVTTEPPAAQMTIFYGGQILLFNNMPADKAKEVIEFANNFESSLKKRKVESSESSYFTSIMIKNNSIPTQNLSHTMNNVAPKFGDNNLVSPKTTTQCSHIFTDLPLARKASLHRFLEKRKDRLVGKAPPSVKLNSGSPAKPVDGKSWLGLTSSLPIFQP